MKKFMLACVIGCLCFGMTACSSGSSNDKETEKETEKEVKKDVYGMNETIAMEECKYTVTGATTSEGDGKFSKPKEGFVFVLIDVTIENTTDDEISYNPLYFDIQNAQGQIEGLGFSTFQPENPFNSGKLAAGGKVSGTLVSQQAADGLDGLILIYKPDVFSKENAKVQLSF